MACIPAYAQPTQLLDATWLSLVSIEKKSTRKYSFFNHDALAKHYHESNIGAAGSKKHTTFPANDLIVNLELSPKT